MQHKRLYAVYATSSGSIADMQIQALNRHSRLIVERASDGEDRAKRRIESKRGKTSTETKHEQCENVNTNEKGTRQITLFFSSLLSLSPYIYTLFAIDFGMFHFAKGISGKICSATRKTKRIAHWANLCCSRWRLVAARFRGRQSTRTDKYFPKYLLAAYFCAIFSRQLAIHFRFQSQDFFFSFLPLLSFCVECVRDRVCCT